jgi:hypothetical protein
LSNIPHEKSYGISVIFALDSYGMILSWYFICKPSTSSGLINFIYALLPFNIILSNVKDLNISRTVAMLVYDGNGLIYIPFDICCI